MTIPRKIANPFDPAESATYAAGDLALYDSPDLPCPEGTKPEEWRRTDWDARVSRLHEAGWKLNNFGHGRSQIGLERN